MFSLSLIELFVFSLSLSANVVSINKWVVLLSLILHQNVLFAISTAKPITFMTSYLLETYVKNGKNNSWSTKNILACFIQDVHVNSTPIKGSHFIKNAFSTHLHVFILSYQYRTLIEDRSAYSKYCMCSRLVQSIRKPLCCLFLWNFFLPLIIPKFMIN